MSNRNTPQVTICSSAHFYRQAVAIKEQLEELGINVILPKGAEDMREAGDYEVDHYKTWFAEPNDYDKKAQLMRTHFDKVTQADAILVLNYEKRGIPNYIGGNVLMEMALAFHMRKPIFILNEIPEESPFLEEILGMATHPLGGEIRELKPHLKRTMPVM